MTVYKAIDFDSEKHKRLLSDAFPAVDCGLAPLGARVVVQLRRVRKVSAGGIVLVPETKETEEANTAVAKVVRLGPLAFRHRDTMQPWAEGVWVKEGDFARVPRWGGDRVAIPSGDEHGPCLFVVLNDHELIARIDSDPLEMRAYV